MKIFATTLLLILMAQPAWAQVDRTRGMMVHFEAEASPERQEWCRSAAAAIMGGSAQGDLEPDLWRLRHCEISGVPALLSAWANPDYLTRALAHLTHITQGIHDRRLLLRMESIAADASRPDLVRFAALAAIMGYVAPGRAPPPDGWFSKDDPEMLRVHRRIHVSWVQGTQPIREEDLRGLRPTLDEIAAREGDPARPIAEYMLRMIPDE